jgi:phosphopentomutase
MTRVICMVLDSVGCGGAPDAAAYGDAGANTLGHLHERIPGFHLPHLASLGLDDLLGMPGRSLTLPDAKWCRLTEISAGKDTTTGHWELMGCAVTIPFATYEAFPREFVDELEARAGCGFIGNLASSGTAILDQLGEEHLRTGKAILYTSADSVLQIAAHEEFFGLERLWETCKIARDLLNERNMRVGRVIARPFVGRGSGDFRRTGNRHDYSMVPGDTLLNRLAANGIPTIGIGKISDIFAGSGISESHATRSNAEGMAAIDQVWNGRRAGPHFIFANLVDFDSLYGHRRDPAGYAACLREFDHWLGTFLPRVQSSDRVIITADHGNDPYHQGTDHTREQVPLLTLNFPNPLRDGVFPEVAELIAGCFSPANR